MNLLVIKKDPDIQYIDQLSESEKKWIVEHLDLQSYSPYSPYLLEDNSLYKSRDDIWYLEECTWLEQVEKTWVLSISSDSTNFQLEIFNYIVNQLNQKRSLS